jgi:hypothetical protein
MTNLADVKWGRETGVSVSTTTTTRKSWNLG